MSLLTTISNSIKSVVRSFLGDEQHDYILLSTLRGEIEYMVHDLMHMAVSQQPPVHFNKSGLVNGVQGVNIPEFHGEPIEVRYEGELDEARLAFYQFYAGTDRKKLLAFIRFLGWVQWLVRRGYDVPSIARQVQCSLAIANNTKHLVNPFI